ncbi:MAG: glycerate kinase [Flavobacteriaceae bacterium]
MQLLIVPDSFKESLPATEVASAIEKGLRKVNKDLNVKCIPFSDGGEGALTILKEIVLDDLYVVEKNEEFKKLVYTNSFSSYRDSLYTNVVFD